MSEPMNLLLSLWIKFFFVFTPFTALTMFLGLTKDYDERRRRRVAVRTSLSVAAFCLALFFFGQGIFDVLGITLDAFRVGAGALLFLSAIRLLTVKPPDAAPAPQEDVAVVPLAMPVIVGPATVGTLLVLGAELPDAGSKSLGCAALAAAVVCVGALLLLGSFIERVLGAKGINVLSKVSGLVLSALAAQMILTGVRNALEIGS
jgi:multiple antibiotic resistance protein